MTIADVINLKVKKTGIPYNVLAERTGIKPARIYQVLGTQRLRMKVDELLILSIYFNLDFKDFYPTIEPKLLQEVQSYGQNT